MPVENNIDEFNDYVSKTFAFLYESFPKPISLHPALYGIGEDPSDDFGQFKRFEPIMHAIGWLVEEGYVRHKGQTMDGAFHLAQLSEKGLAAMRSVPDSVQGETPLGERIGNAVKSGSAGLARKLAEEAIAWGFKQVTGG